jgi:hypothetical protein
LLTCLLIQAAGPPLASSEVNALFRLRFPDVDSSTLAAIFSISVDNCTYYIQSTLMKEYGYTLLKSEHFLTVTCDPRTFCFDTIQQAIKRVEAKIEAVPSVPACLNTMKRPNIVKRVTSSNNPFSAKLPLSNSHSPYLSSVPTLTPSVIQLPPGTGSTNVHNMLSNFSPFSGTNASSMIHGPPVQQGQNIPTQLVYPPLQSLILPPKATSVIHGPPIAPPIASSSSSISRSKESTKPGPDIPSGTRCNKEYEEHYCRDWNLRFLGNCSHTHLYRSGIHRKVESKQDYSLEELNPDTVEYDEQSIIFSGAWMLSNRPIIKKIEKVICPKLEDYYEDTKVRMTKKYSKYCTPRFLFHGTCEAIHEIVFQYGLQAPSDYEVSPNCLKCGHLHGKILTSTCLKNCEHCAGSTSIKHTWKNCHMFGLGIYFADQSSKADIYVRDKLGKKVDKGKKMLVVGVLLGETHIIHSLKTKDDLHDIIEAPNGKDSIMAVGQGRKSVPHFQVMNNECTTSFSSYQIRISPTHQLTQFESNALFAHRLMSNFMCLSFRSFIPSRHYFQSKTNSPMLFDHLRSGIGLLVSLQHFPPQKSKKK